MSFSVRADRRKGRLTRMSIIQSFPLKGQPSHSRMGHNELPPDAMQRGGEEMAVTCILAVTC